MASRISVGALGVSQTSNLFAQRAELQNQQRQQQQQGLLKAGQTLIAGQQQKKENLLAERKQALEEKKAGAAEATASEEAKNKFLQGTIDFINEAPPESRQELLEGSKRAAVSNNLMTQEESDQIEDIADLNFLSSQRGLGTVQIGEDEFKAVSPAGKEIQDEMRLRALDKPEQALSLRKQRLDKEAKLQKTAADKSASENFGNANVLRDDLTRDIKADQGVVTAFKKMESAEETGAGDVSLVFGFFKMIDPGSTVREGEFATAEQTAGLPAKAVIIYNKLISGERLSATQRKDFLSQGGSLAQVHQDKLDGTVNDYKERANRAGIDPRDVVPSRLLDKAGRVSVTLQTLGSVSVEDLGSMTLEELEALRR